MNNLLLSVMPAISEWSFPNILMAVVLIGGCIAIPQWAINIFWVVVVVFVAIFAIKLVLSM